MRTQSVRAVTVRALVGPFLSIAAASTATAGFDVEVFDLGDAKPYALIQLGDDGGDMTSPGNPEGGNKLEITSNSSVFGSTLKGEDDSGEKNKITTSKVTGSWDRESTVTNDISSSHTGARDDLTPSEFKAVADDAVAKSKFWADAATTRTFGNGFFDLNGSSATETIDGMGIGANVIDVDGDFNLNSGARLTLTGKPGDFFVINIDAGALFSINSHSVIALGGDIEPEEVLFNVLGNISADGEDGALIGSGSIFQGTLLAPGRKVEVTTNHFYTFQSGGFPDDFGGTQAPSTTQITGAQAVAAKDAGSDFGGLFGQLIVGGTLNFTESDIAYHPFMTMPNEVIPEASAFVTWLLISATALTRRRR